MPLQKIGGAMAPLLPTKFDKSGGAITGATVIDSTGTAALTIDKNASGDVALIKGQMDGKDRWQIDLGDAAAEGASAGVGSDFFLRRFNNQGNTQIGLSMGVRRSDGELFFEKIPRVGGFAGAPLVERGSNANGEYVKFADGTMICSRSWTASVAVTTIYAEVYYGVVAWTYPATFSSVQHVSLTGKASGRLALMSGLADLVFNPSTVNLYIADLDSSHTANYLMGAIAFGRWN